MYFTDVITQPRNISQETHLKDFYRLLESIHSTSATGRISTLQAFLRDNPNFEQVYLKLLENYLLQNSIQSAKLYFEQLALDSKYCRNGRWMLAKIYTYLDNPDSAFVAYYQALRYGQPSPALVRDFAEFSQRLQGKQDSLIDRGKSCLSQQKQVFYAAILNYLNQDFDRALKEILKLPKTQIHDLYVMQLLGFCYLIAFFTRMNRLYTNFAQFFDLKTAKTYSYK